MSERIDCSKLEKGKYYWAVARLPEGLWRVAPGTTFPQPMAHPMPVRFTGMGGGSPMRPTWDFIGIDSALELWEVIWIGEEIKFDARAAGL